MVPLDVSWNMKKSYSERIEKDNPTKKTNHAHVREADPFLSNTPPGKLNWKRYNISSWWFQPIWKICSSNWIISPSRGEHKKYFICVSSSDFGDPPRSESIPSWESNRLFLLPPQPLSTKIPWLVPVPNSGLIFPWQTYLVRWGLLVFEKASRGWCFSLP